MAALRPLVQTVLHEMMLGVAIRRAAMAGHPRYPQRPRYGQRRPGLGRPRRDPRLLSPRCGRTGASGVARALGRLDCGERRLPPDDLLGELVAHRGDENVDAEVAVVVVVDPVTKAAELAEQLVVGHLLIERDLMIDDLADLAHVCLLYTSPSPRD